MSSPPDEKELKGGHPPAVKAGGKRITSKHHHIGPPPLTPEEKAENEKYAEPKERDTTKLVISGAVVKGNPDFPPQAVKVAHEKPVPQHEKRPPGPGGKGANISIQQPRKN